MNTRTRELGNAKSGVPTNAFECNFHPRTPLRMSNERKRHSVERLPLERIAAMFLERVSVGFLKFGSDTSQMRASSKVLSRCSASQSITR